MLKVDERASFWFGLKYAVEQGLLFGSMNGRSWERIIDITGSRGSIDLGIPITATVEYAVQIYRSRRHRVRSLIDIEKEILKLRLQGLSSEDDVRLWKGVGDSFNLSQDSVRARHGS